MKRKEEVSLPEVKGWTLLKGVRSYCRQCGAFRDFHQQIYWKREGQRTVISCEECVKS